MLTARGFVILGHMAARGALAKSPSQTAMAAEFRVSKMAELRKRSRNIPNFTRSATEKEGQPEGDQQDELRRRQIATRQANGIGSPLRESFPALYANLGENSEQTEAANNTQTYGDDMQGASMDQEMIEQYTALQTQEEQDDRKRSRFRSMLENSKEKQQSEMMKKAKEELEIWLKQREADLVARGSSLVDDGEFFELVDTAGNAITAYQAVITVFQDSIPQQVQQQMKYPPWKFKDAANIFSASSGISLFMKELVLVAVIAPYIIIFFYTMLAALTDLCGWNLACKAAIATL